MDGKARSKKLGLDRQRYNRIASFYDPLESPMELFNYARWRKIIFQYLPRTGRILEIGVGTGRNLPYYTRGQRVIGIDISERMLQRARKKNSEASVDLVQMDVELLGFPDETFDAAVSTYVF